MNVHYESSMVNSPTYVYPFPFRVEVVFWRPLSVNGLRVLVSREYA